MDYKGERKLPSSEGENLIDAISNTVKQGWEQIKGDESLRKHVLKFIGAESLGMLGVAALKESGITVRETIEGLNIQLPDSFISDFNESIDLIDNTSSGVFVSLGLVGFIGSYLAKRELPGGVSTGRLLAAHTKLLINKVLTYRDVEI